jgi:hypothetical protein
MVAEPQVERRTSANDVNEKAMFVVNMILVKAEIIRIEILE